jgi:hypothetical protein
MRGVYTKAGVCCAVEVYAVLLSVCYVYALLLSSRRIL